MKIFRIAATNFMRLREIDIELPHALSLFCGDNDVGKSSLQEALRLAFVGEAARVELKKHWPHMVRRGAKSASIVVDWMHQAEAKKPAEQGRASVALPSGKVDCHPEVPAATPFVLDAPRFAALEENARRKFLFDLIGIKLDVPSVKQRLLKRGCRHDLIEAVAPVLRTGFEASHQWAVDKQAEYRGAWKNLTGEVYGEKKAETWRAPLTGAEVNREQISGLQESITTISAEITAVTKDVGAGEAYLQHKSRYDREAKGLKDQGSLVGRRKKEMDEAERSIAKHRPVLEKAEAALADARLQGQPCPECGSMLAIQPEGKLIAVPAVGKKELAEIESNVEAARSTMRILTETHARAKSDYEAAVRAAETLAALERAMGTPMTPETLAGRKKQLAELEFDVEKLTGQLQDLQKQIREVDQAQQTTKDAKNAHQLVLDWGSVAEALAPDGVPGDLLQEALGPINKRLKKSAESTGWAQVSLEGDMQILVGEIPYRLCGESVRWRADAMLAEAISYTAGLGLLVLDRIDVLAPERRGGLLDWCYDLAEKDAYGCILLFGTLKAKPQLEGVNVFWMEDGKV